MVEPRPPPGDLPEEERKRLSDLFNQLDVNKDGKIDIRDLSEAWAKLHVPHRPGQAEVILRHISSKLVTLQY